MYESSTQDENYMLYTVSTAIRSRPYLEHDPADIKATSQKLTDTKTM